MRTVSALAVSLVLIAAACSSSDSGDADEAATDTTAAVSEPEATSAPAPTDPPVPETTTTTEPPPPPLNVVGLVPLPGGQFNFSAQPVETPSLVWSLYSGSGGVIVEDVIEPLPDGCHGTSFFDPATFELLQIGDEGLEAYATVGEGGCDNMSEPGKESVVDGDRVKANEGTFIQFDFGELPPLPFDVSTQVLNPDGQDGIFRSADPDAPVVINDLTDATHVIGWSDLFELDPADGSFLPVPQPETSPGPGCDEFSLCLKDGRIQVDLVNAEGSPGSVLSSSDDSGLFFFFSPEEIDAYLTLVNGCGINGHFWVFAAAATEVAFDLTVTDTATGETREYFSPLGELPEPILDTEAFATCP